MTKHQSPVEVALEMIKELKEYERNGGKQAFKEALRKEFVQRSGHPSLDQLCSMAWRPWPLCFALSTCSAGRKPGNRYASDNRRQRHTEGSHD
jgi:hypothetical protein